jgi:Zn-dependent alcohol dehydrogenase
VRLFQLGKFKLKEQITHRFPLERVNEAIEIVRSGEAGRCLLAMN